MSSHTSLLGISNIYGILKSTPSLFICLSKGKIKGVLSWSLRHPPTGSQPCVSFLTCSQTFVGGRNKWILKQYRWLLQRWEVSKWLTMYNIYSSAKTWMDWGKGANIHHSTFSVTLETGRKKQFFKHCKFCLDFKKKIFTAVWRNFMAAMIIILTFV